MPVIRGINTMKNPKNQVILKKNGEAFASP